MRLVDPGNRKYRHHRTGGRCCIQPRCCGGYASKHGQLNVPDGFRAAPFATNLGKPRIQVTSPAGHRYYADRETGTITLLHDANGNGKAEVKTVVATIRQPHGLALHKGNMYIAAVRELYRAPINPDGTLGTPALLRNGLPDAGQHPNRTLAFGPDGRMYRSIDSTCIACAEPNPLNATMAVQNAGLQQHPTQHYWWAMNKACRVLSINTVAVLG